MDLYFRAHAKQASITTPKLLDHAGNGDLYVYETLNLVDGRRNARQIRDALSVAYGDVPLALVVEYLVALERIGVVEKAR